MAAGTHMAATSHAADEQTSSLYFSGICQTISVKCQHRNENGLLTCARNLYVSCPHCHLLLCIDHIHEHENLLRYEIEQLINETNIVKANIRALLTTTQQPPSSASVQVLDEKQRTLCELLERWATVGKISMSQAALIQHQCGYISQTTQQQTTTTTTTSNTPVASVSHTAATTNHHAHHSLTAQQNGTTNANSNKLPAHHQSTPIPSTTGHTQTVQTNHHQITSQQQTLVVNPQKKRRSGKNKIVTLLMKNADGEYECPNVQCRKSLKCQGITAHVKACAVDWLKENDFACLLINMRGASSLLFTGSNDCSQPIALKIWWKTGHAFEEIFDIGRSTFIDVKRAAIRYFEEQYPKSLLKNHPFSSVNQSIDHRTDHQINVDDDNYKLISIESKRVVNENLTLKEGRIKDQDEFLLAERKFSKVRQTTSNCLIDEKLIDLRTDDLGRPSNSFSHDFRIGTRTEFRADLNCILITLIETSQKLLWCHPDAENIFKQAEEILMKSTMDESNSNSSNSDSRFLEKDLICKLMEMGFTERQSQIALHRTKNDLHAAMELILIEPDLIDDQQQTNDPSQSKTTTTTTFFTRDGPFIPFRQYRQQRFKTNSQAAQSLKDMGFKEDEILEALRRFNNDQNLACEYLLGDRQQKQTIIESNNDEALDPNSSMFQSIMQNPIIQRTLNNPKTFFVMLKISENPSTVGNYLNDPDIGNMLLQISRIYHAERDQLHSMSNNRPTTNDLIQVRINSTMTDHFQVHFENDTE